MCIDIKIFLGEDEEDEVIDEEMDGLETEGDLPPTKESNADRNYSGSAQVRSSSVIKGQEKLNNMAF